MRIAGWPPVLLWSISDTHLAGSSPCRTRLCAGHRAPKGCTMTSVFLSYARSDDEPFVRRLYDRLIQAGFRIWFDKVSKHSRQLVFYQEIRGKIADCHRLVLVVGPGAVSSDYVGQEWRFAYFEALKCVNPIVRLDAKDAAGKPIDGYSLLPRELVLIHAEDFRRDAEFDEHCANLIRRLSEPLPPAGKLVAVPELPPHFVTQPDRINALRDILLADLTKPVVVGGVRSSGGAGHGRHRQERTGVGAGPPPRGAPRLPRRHLLAYTRPAAPPGGTAQLSAQFTRRLRHLRRHRARQAAYALKVKGSL
jgi:TIR domain